MVECRGAPKYLDYVHSSVAQKREKVRSGEAREENPNQQNWYGKEKPVDGELVKCVVGNPNLVYEGVLIPSFEPNGIEVCCFLFPRLSRTNRSDAGWSGSNKICGRGEMRLDCSCEEGVCRRGYRPIDFYFVLPSTVLSKQ
jgi:hypothetical protein